MTDAEIDALWFACRETGDMRVFARAVADAAGAERDALRRCLTMDGTDVVGFPSDFNVAVMPTMRYDALMAERDALLELVGDLDAHEGAEGWSEGMRERINAALAKENDRG
jgi:hypothetical protein